MFAASSAVLLAGSDAAPAWTIEILVPGDIGSTTIRAPSCRAKASTILEPRPAVVGSGPVGMPRPESLTERVHAAPSVT